MNMNAFMSFAFIVLIAKSAECLSTTRATSRNEAIAKPTNHEDLNALVDKCVDDAVDIYLKDESSHDSLSHAINYRSFSHNYTTDESSFQRSQNFRSVNTFLDDAPSIRQFNVYPGFFRDFEDYKQLGPYRYVNISELFIFLKV